MKTKPLIKINKLKDKVWTVYSTLRRMSAADFQGNVVCYTCNKVLHWKEAHLGHFKHNKVDFDPRNTRIQCTGCNTYRGGRLDVYAVKLIEEIGLEAVKDLEICAARFVRYTRQELNEFLIKFREELKKINDR